MSSVVIAGNTSGSVTLDAPAVAGTTVLTLPATSGTVVTTATTTGISGSAISTGTVAVSVGGTGANTLTANNVILGNGTSAVQFVAPGSSGNVLTSNGTTWTSAAAGGGQLQTQIFTAPGTWTKPATVSSVKVTVVAGGGGGAAFTNAQSGGAGGYAIASNVPVAAPVAVTVGSGGNGGTFPSAGSSGSSSSFGPLVSATGGAGASPGAPGANGTSTVSAGTILRAVPSAPINNNAASIISLINGSALLASPTSSPQRFAVAYSETGSYAAGQNGGGTNSGSGSSAGGTGGVVIVEWIG